jgi:hypothetical protein
MPVYDENGCIVVIPTVFREGQKVEINLGDPDYWYKGTLDMFYPVLKDSIADMVGAPSGWTFEIDHPDKNLCGICREEQIRAL